MKKLTLLSLSLLSLSSWAVENKSSTTLSSSSDIRKWGVSLEYNTLQNADQTKTSERAYGRGVVIDREFDLSNGYSTSIKLSLEDYSKSVEIYDDFQGTEL